MTPTTAAVPVELTVGIIIIPGFTELHAALIEIIVEGINWIQVAFKTKKSAISFDAVSLSLLSLSISSIALIPNGVAALDNPIILAVRFITIAPKVFSSLAASLNMHLSTGFNTFDIFPVSPLFSATFITPHQKHIIPVSSIIKVTVLPDELIIALEINSPFPLTNPTRIPQKIKANQIIYYKENFSWMI